MLFACPFVAAGTSPLVPLTTSPLQDGHIFVVGEGNWRFRTVCGYETSLQRRELENRKIRFFPESRVWGNEGA